MRLLGPLPTNGAGGGCVEALLFKEQGGSFMLEHGPRHRGAGKGGLVVTYELVARMGQQARGGRALCADGRRQCSADTHSAGFSTGGRLRGRNNAKKLVR